MKNKSYNEMQCPIARSLQQVGEWWSILILRESMKGITRFDDFQKMLDIATSTLTKRLNGLVDSGLLDKKQYSEKPPRYEYVLTQKGIDFRPVILTLLAWGNQYCAEEGLSIVLVDRETQENAEISLVDKRTGKDITFESHVTMLGPAANEELIRQYKPA